MDNVRIRLKLRDNEFEAEGPEGLVRAHLAEFKSLLPGAAAPETPANAPHALMFQADKASGALVLRILPSTNQGILKQVTNTLLLTLFGFQEAMGIPKVPVLAATQTIRQSGLVAVSRLSNAFLKLQKEGLAMKIGRGKGTQYQLTAKGLKSARELIQNSLSRANL